MGIVLLLLTVRKQREGVPSFRPSFTISSDHRGRSDSENTSSISIGWCLVSLLQKALADGDRGSVTALTPKQEEERQKPKKKRSFLN